jgi:hypothetical protein
MKQSASCCHPLNFISSDNSSISRGIFVFDFSRINNCYSFKSSVRMKAYSRTFSILLWWNIPGYIIIKHEKRTCFVRHASVISRNVLCYTKSIPYHMIVTRMLHAKYCFLHTTSIVIFSIESIYFIKL